MLDVEFIYRLRCGSFSVNNEYIHMIGEMRNNPDKHIPKYMRIDVRYPSIRILDNSILVLPICIGMLNSVEETNTSTMCVHVGDLYPNLELYMKSLLFDIHIVATATARISGIFVNGTFINTRKYYVSTDYEKRISRILDNIYMIKDIEYIEPGEHCKLCKYMESCSNE